MSGDAHALPDDLLEQPAVRAARLMALSLLETLVDRRATLDSSDDPEALHDFRVALRRLRSHLRAYRETLDGSVSGKSREWLRDLARATSASRDGEVHLAWLEEQRPSTSPRQRPGVAWLMDRVATRKHEADAALATVLHDDFADRCDALARRLDAFWLKVPVRGAIRTPRLAAVAAELVADHAKTFHARLADVHDAWDVQPAHVARIAGKRLRYLIEPLAARSPEGPALVDALKGLQDTLGDLHDAHVFADEIAQAARAAATEEADQLAAAVRRGRGESARRTTRDPRPGLLELGERLRSRGARAFDALSSAWLGEASRVFFEQCGSFVERLRDVGASSDVEIERKYLLTSLPEHVADAESREIEQGYLPGTRLIERLRRETSTAGERFIRTIKVGTGVARAELEEETTRAMFETMWPLTEGRRIRKRRYVVPDRHLVWEIDEFLDRDLVLAEVELEDADATIEPPKWLSPLIVREVTGEGGFANVNLAR